MDGMRRFKISSVIKIVSKYYSSSSIDKCGLGLIIALIFFNPSFVIAQSSLFDSESRTISRLPLFYEVTAEAEAIANRLGGSTGDGIGRVDIQIENVRNVGGHAAAREPANIF